MMPSAGVFGRVARTDQRRALELHLHAFALLGRVHWTNDLRPFGDNINPGMGIMFVDLALSDRERLVSTIKTIAYLRSDPPMS